MGRERLLAPKLFIEGIEVPMEEASFTHTVNQASVCYISLPSHNILKDIKPRSYVQLFVRDTNNPDPALNMPYVLAWDGEVFGFEMMKASTGRNFRIMCIDLSSYWDNILSFFFNTQQSGGSGAMGFTNTARAYLTAEKQGLRVEATLPSQISYFRVKIDKVMAETGKDFLDAVLSIYDDVAMVNDFYAAAEDRLRIKDRIKLRSSGQIQEIVKQGEGLEWYTGVMGRSTGLQTLRQTVNDLMSIIFHDGVTMPFPSRVPRQMEGKALKDSPKSGKTSIGQFIFKPNLFMMPPPLCNVFFPEEYSQFTYSRNFFEEPTRLVYSPELPSKGDGNVPLVITQIYEPASFRNFMVGKDPNTAYQGDGDFDIPRNIDIGLYKEPDKNQSKALNNGATRQPQFTTNEEMMKGIWSTSEGSMPATSAHRASLKDVGLESFQNAVGRYLFFKKRFEKRSCQITSAFKMSVVPGFPCLILDDSEAKQNVVAYVVSVTHRVSATQGGYTQVTLSYARDVTEQDTSTNNANTLLIPPWFDKAIFGENAVPDKSEGKKAEELGNQHVSRPELNKFYEELLGTKGSKAVTGLYQGKATLVGATEELLKEYTALKLKNNDVILDDFIYQTTARNYVRAWHAADFLGAKPNAPDLSKADFVELQGDVFIRKGKIDEEAVKNRRKVIVQYANEMRARRGFRG